MKKTIQFTVILFLLSFNAYSQIVAPINLPAVDPPPKVLMVDANVTVMLVQTENAILQIEGKKFFREYVTVKTSGDTLTIAAAKNQNLLTAGVVYVPARELKLIRVNSGADIRTLFALKIPHLDVIVNGACTLAIANFGEVNVIEAKGYAAEKSTRVRQYPTGIF